MGLSDEALLERLNEHPGLRSRVESMLLAVMDEKGELQEADAAEMLLIEQMRRMGQESLQAWATGQAVKAADSVGHESGVWRGGKKLQWHSTFGEITVEEIQYRHGNQHIRPFVNRAKVRHRGCSRPLQRVVTDFGADVAFAQVEDKLVEHYGIILPESTIRRVTESHAEKLHHDTG